MDSAVYLGTRSRKFERSTSGSKVALNRLNGPQYLLIRNQI